MSWGSTSASSLRPECSISQTNNYWAFVTGISQGSYLTQCVTLRSKRQCHQQKAELCQVHYCCFAASFLAITNNCGKTTFLLSIENRYRCDTTAGHIFKFKIQGPVFHSQVNISITLIKMC